MTYATTAATSASAAQLFGSSLVAMVSPMKPDGSLDESGTHKLVEHLLATGCDGLVVTGTTGESPTLSEDESNALLASVVEQAGGRARVIAGVGSYDTVSTVRRAQQAEAAGAHGLLVVCPYYSKPTQAGVAAHFVAVADATELPVMLYDIPGRAGIPIEEATLQTLAAHPRIRAVKDAKGDLFQAMSLMQSTTLAYYCGIDELNLPYLACGATGLVSVVGNVAGDRTAELIRAVRRGDLAAARAINESLMPLTRVLMRTSSGAIMAKAALAELGIIEDATVRLPLVESPAEHLALLREVLGEVAVAA